MQREKLFKSSSDLSFEFARKEEELVFQEYAEIDQTKETCTVEELVVKYPVAFSEENFNKNRYRNVLPLERSRVRLNSSNSDYINANHIPSLLPNSKEHFITTQAPIPSTFSSFWQMVWEQNTPVVVMLTRLVEKGRKKADQYWPELDEEEIQYGEFEISCKSIQKIGPFYIRRMMIQFGSEVREIFHIHYPEWPDHGIPEDTSEIRELLRRIKLYRQSGQSTGLDGPLVVHCSAGLGRSGTLISIMLALEQLENGFAPSDVDIQEIVKHLRSHRSNMVQTPNQYLLIYRVVEDLIKEKAPENRRRKLHRTFSSPPKCSSESPIDLSHSPRTSHFAV